MSLRKVKDNLLSYGVGLSLLTNDYQSPGNRDLLRSLSPEVTKKICLPSSNQCYFSIDAYLIPWPAWKASPEQIEKDYSAHFNQEETFYRKKSQILDLDGDILLVELLHGRSHPEWIKDRYLIPIARAFNRQTEAGRFSGYFDSLDIIQMIQDPMNPAMIQYFEEASRVAGSQDESEIQEYLDQVGIIHFRAKEIIRFPRREKLFWLTRFHGASGRDYKRIACLLSYYEQANGSRSLEMIEKLKDSPFIFETSQVERMIQEVNRVRSYKPLIEELGITRDIRLTSSFSSYFQLYFRSNSLPLLTLALLRDLSRHKVLLSLTNYTDREIVRILGDSSADTREDFLLEAVIRSQATGIFLLTSEDFCLCQNEITSISLEPFKNLDSFIGRGSLATGFICYSIPDLIETFESTRDSDGFYTFSDPAITRKNFTLQELESLTRLSGHQTKKFKEYLQIAKDQQTVDQAIIRKIRRWIQDSSQRDLMKGLLVSFFRMGMYMRQWKGPGHPYPLSSRETGNEAPKDSDLEKLILENVISERMKFLEFMSELPEEIQGIVWHLPFYFTNNEQNPEKKDFDIATRYNDVFENRRHPLCIRMASAPWSYTGAYYYRQILQESIPDYDISIPPDFIH